MTTGTDVVKVASRDCGYCSRRYSKRPKQSAWGFARSKFCSVACAQKGQKRTGSSHKPRTHCTSGDHEWIPENLYTDNRGQSKCKPCARRRDKGRKRPARVRKPRPRVQPRAARKPKPKPAFQSIPTVPTTPRPIWRPVGFAPVPITRRSA